MLGNGEARVYKPDGEAAAKCWVMGKLEFTGMVACGGEVLGNGEARVYRHGGQAVANCWVMGKLEFTCLVVRQ